MVSSCVPARVEAAPSCVLVAPRDVIVSPFDFSCLSDTEPLGDFGFRRQHRLLKPAEFSDVFAARHILRGGLFTLHYRNNDRSVARLGLVVPKKQARTAALRNAIKRQAREAFRLRCAGLPALDLVLRLSRPVAAIDKPAWRAEMVTLFDRIGSGTRP